MIGTASRRALQGGGATTAAMNDDGLGIPPAKLKAKKATATAVATTTTTATRIPAGIVADERWPGMYRVKLRRGQLSDMLSLTRAKDALASRK